MILRTSLVVVFVVACAAACGPSVTVAMQAYAKAIDDVAAAGKEDIDRCENAATDADRTAFCERAKKHFDVIKGSADTLSVQSK